VQTSARAALSPSLTGSLLVNPKHPHFIFRRIILERPTTPATITLADGKERILRYSLKAMKKLKSQFGASLFRGGLNDLDEDKLPELLFHGLNHKYEGGDPNLTLDEVEELVDAQMLPYVMERFLTAFGGSVPEKNAAKPAIDTIIPPTPVM
jgi:hypothetical protein